MKKILSFLLIGFLFFPLTVSAKTAQQMYWDALDRIVKAKTMVVGGTVNITSKMANTKNKNMAVSSAYSYNNGNLGINFNIKIDKSNPEEQRVFYSFGFVPSEEIKNNLPISDVKVVSLGSTSYFYITADSLDLGFLDLSLFINRWVKIDRDGILQQFLGDKYADVKADLDAKKKSNQITPEQMDSIIKLFKKNNIFNVYRLADKKVSGKTYNQLRLRFNKVNFRKFIIAASKEINGKSMTVAELKDLDKIIKTLQVPDSVLLVDKNSGAPARLDFSVKRNDGIRNLTTTVRINFISFNEGVDIYAPSEPTNFEDIFSAVMGQFKNNLDNSYATSTVSTTFNVSTTFSL